MVPLRTFEEIAKEFEDRFMIRHFPAGPERLYNAAEYLLSLKGKRIRPVLCMMANELFTPLTEDTIHAAFAIELFHNFTLVHDDIMDRARLRRGQPTVHEKFGTETALLAGDVLLVKAYEYLRKVHINFLTRSMDLFSETAKQVCEGQQLDMDYENQRGVTMDQYLEMIGLKTSVLIAASLKMGALLGGAGPANRDDLYGFGKNLGIAFQIQDDYLDAFGDPELIGKKTGGDIMSNKMTFLLVRTMETANEAQKQKLEQLLALKDDSKIEQVIALYTQCGVNEWARQMKMHYFNKAMAFLEDVAVVSKRKEPLKLVAHALLDRNK